MLNKKTEALMEKLRNKRHAMMQLLKSENGKDLLAELESTFYDGDIIAATVEQTYANLGAREVVRFLKSIRDSQEEK